MVKYIDLFFFLFLTDQEGIISCMTFNPQLPDVFAAGSYSGTIGELIACVKITEF